jgi:hypothetical protein
LKALNEVDHKIVTGNEAVIDSVDRIEKLLTNILPIATSATIKQCVTRAIAGLAPYHRSKNSVGDAILIATCAEASGRRTGKRVSVTAKISASRTATGANHTRILPPRSCRQNRPIGGRSSMSSRRPEQIFPSELESTVWHASKIDGLGSAIRFTS